MAEKIAFISLGCSKNLVDSEQMKFLLKQSGYQAAAGLEEADAVVINTCGFIDEAKQEAVDNILELCEVKADESLPLRAVIVAGCLSERYREELLTEIPEIDAVVGSSACDKITEAVTAALSGEKALFFGDKNAPVIEGGRILETPGFYAYVKIGEGCSNCCSYCTIPSIRGSMRSRKPEAIINECRELVKSGAKELIIIGQDITKYGEDFGNGPQIVPLLTEICKIEGLSWLRLHYANPDGVSDELIDLIAQEAKILKYLDMPVQHVNTKVLRDMARRYDGEHVRTLVSKLRDRVPGIVLRTSLIVGFPGEGELEFEELCEFLREARFERAGVFAFSPQEGTLAAGLTEQTDDDEKRDRTAIVTELQYDVMEDYAAGRVGSIVTVLCEGFDRAAGVWFGRSFAESPEVDGKVFFKTAKGRVTNPGDFVDILVTDVMAGDIVGNAL